MDKVIETLFSIEERAQKIMEATANEKLALKNEYDAKKSDYEKQLKASAQSRLKESEARLKAHYDEEYKETRQRTTESITTLCENFKKNHTEMARSIFAQITEE